MDDKVDAAIESLKPVRTSLASLLILVIPALILGILARSEVFQSSTNLIVCASKFAPIALLMFFTASQALTVVRDGIVVRKAFRRPERYAWNEITSFNYNRWLRYITIRSEKGLIYLNSTDALPDCAKLLMIVGAKTDYRCSAGLRREIEECWDQVS